ncbi:MAG TPA: hypothetical protein VH583_01545 [Vicinamibacterales bacterium]|jgi:hypothetical protein
MQASEHVLDHVNRGFTPVNVHLAVFLATFSPSLLAHKGLALTARACKSSFWCPVLLRPVRSIPG